MGCAARHRPRKRTRADAGGCRRPPARRDAALRVDDLVDPAHLEWPGGGEPRFPMQLWRRRVRPCRDPPQPEPSPSMSLWTPGGEHPVDRPGGGRRRPTDGRRRRGPHPRGAGPARRDAGRDGGGAAAAARRAGGGRRGQPRHGPLRAGRPPPRRASRRSSPRRALAIDALGALVDGLEGRLGDDEPTLREALGQLRAGLPRRSERDRRRDRPGRRRPATLSACSMRVASQRPMPGRGAPRR